MGDPGYQKDRFAAAVLETVRRGTQMVTFSTKFLEILKLSNALPGGVIQDETALQEVEFL